MNFRFSDRAMLHASGREEELALLQPDSAVPTLHPESPLDHQE
jgi:hypothetical protein